MKESISRHETIGKEFTCSKKDLPKLAEKARQLDEKLRDKVLEIEALVKENAEVVGICDYGIVISMASCGKPLLSCAMGGLKGQRKAFENVVTIINDLEKYK